MAEKQAFSVDDIDEAMVERVYQRAKRLGVLVRPDLKAEIRMMLESALTPPNPEPEIVVTPRMQAAGENAWRLWVAEAPEETWPSYIARVYTDMERERMREAAESPSPSPPLEENQLRFHQRAEDVVGAKGSREHRRATDEGGRKAPAFRGISYQSPQFIPGLCGAEGSWTHTRRGDAAAFFAIHRRKDDR